MTIIRGSFKPALVAAVAHYGIEAQITKAIEEMGELIVALSRFKNLTGNVESVVDEIVDVAIMMEQLATVFGESEVHARANFKVGRLLNRIAEAKIFEESKS